MSRFTPLPFIDPCESLVPIAAFCYDHPISGMWVTPKGYLDGPADEPISPGGGWENTDEEGSA